MHPGPANSLGAHDVVVKIQDCWWGVHLIACSPPKTRLKLYTAKCCVSSSSESADADTDIGCITYGRG